MKLEGRRILVTGASGGIGACLVQRLAGRRPGMLILVGRNAERLETQVESLQADGQDALAIVTDFRDSDAAERVARQAREAVGGVDILINNAGGLRFRFFSEETPEAFDRLLRVNLLAPMRLTHALLPEMLERRLGQIVNVGSTYGALAFPGFAAYSAGKFALRGWSEALRRELTGSGVKVVYVAPRATQTSFNDARVEALNAAMKAAVDDPHRVATRIVTAMLRDRAEYQLGWPEKALVRLNALFPRLIDKALRARLSVIRRFSQVPQPQQSQ